MICYFFYTPLLLLFFGQQESRSYFLALSFNFLKGLQAFDLKSIYITYQLYGTGNQTCPQLIHTWSLYNPQCHQHPTFDKVYLWSASSNHNKSGPKHGLSQLNNPASNPTTSTNYKNHPSFLETCSFEAFYDSLNRQRQACGLFKL